MSVFLESKPLFGWHDKTLIKDNDPGLAVQPVPKREVLKSVWIEGLTTLPRAVNWTMSPLQIVVLAAVKLILQPTVALTNVTIFATQPAFWSEFWFVNLRVRTPEALFAQNIPGFNSAAAVLTAGCPTFQDPFVELPLYLLP